jgi:hypothetical protein
LIFLRILPELRGIHALRWLLFVSVHSSKQHKPLIRFLVVGLAVFPAHY